MAERKCILHHEDAEKQFVSLTIVYERNNYGGNGCYLYPACAKLSSKKGLCCRNLSYIIECSMCQESVQIPIKETILDDILSKEINKIHDHTSILQKLLILRSNKGIYPEFTINNEGKCVSCDGTQIQPDTRLIDVKKDILCGLCEKPIKCYDITVANNANNILSYNVYPVIKHYNEHTDKGEYYGKYVKPTVNLEDAVKKAFENYKIMEKTDENIISMNTQYFGTDQLTKPIFDAVIKSKGDCSCGSKTIFECKLCGNKWKGLNHELRDYYKKCIKTHMGALKRRPGTYRDFIIESTDNAKCVICDMNYESVEVLPDIVLSHFNKCLKKNSIAVKRKMGSC